MRLHVGRRGGLGALEGGAQALHGGRGGLRARLSSRGPAPRPPAAPPPRRALTTKTTSTLFIKVYFMNSYGKILILWKKGRLLYNSGTQNELIKKNGTQG